MCRQQSIPMCTALEHGFAKTKHWKAHTNSRSYTQRSFRASQSTSQTGTHARFLSLSLSLPNALYRLLCDQYNTHTTHTVVVYFSDYTQQGTNVTTSGYITHMFFPRARQNDRETANCGSYVHTAKILCKVESDIKWKAMFMCIDRILKVRQQKLQCNSFQ